MAGRDVEVGNLGVEEEGVKGRKGFLRRQFTSLMKGLNQWALGGGRSDWVRDGEGDDIIDTGRFEKVLVGLMGPSLRLLAVRGFDGGLFALVEAQGK